MKFIRLLSLFFILATVFPSWVSAVNEEDILTGDTKICEAEKYSENGHAVYLPINGYNKKYVFVDGGEFKKYKNGTATLKGTVKNVSKGDARWEIFLFFSSKRNYYQVKQANGEIKGANLGDEKKWDYYRIDSKKSYFKGKGHFAGKFLKINDRSGKYWVQLGHGANDKNRDYGLSTWFKATGSMTLYGDVNIVLDCGKKDDTPPNNEKEEIYLEAECADIGDYWVKKNDQHASDHTYLTPKQGKNSYHKAPSGSKSKVKFTFNSKEGGNNWMLNARVLCKNGQDDSFWVRINNGNWIKWWKNLQTGNQYDWKKLKKKEGAGEVYKFSLRKGMNTIEFAYREDGARLDKICVANYNASKPNGKGPKAEKSCKEDPKPEYIVLEGCYSLVAEHSNKTLGFRPHEKHKGAYLKQWNYEGGEHLQFELKHLGNGEHKITAKHSGKVLDASGYGKHRGTKVHQWSWHSGDNQRWYVEKANDGSYFFRNKHNGLYLDVSSVSKKEGAILHLWTFHGGGNQKFMLKDCCVPLAGAGVITGDEDKCGEYDAMPITGEHIGDHVMYKWEMKKEGGNWMEIQGANAKDYDPGLITETTYYRRVAIAKSECKDKVYSNKVVKTVSPGETLCYSRPWKEGEREVFFPLPDHYRDYVFEGEGALFAEYPDGTAKITGTMVNTQDPLVRWKVYVFLGEKKNYDEWTNAGGFAKEDRGEFGDETTWSFYKVDGTKSFFKGLDKVDGKLVYIKDSDPNYAFQVGNGANNYNSDYGASGWFETSGSYKDVKGDFNISFNCVCKPKPFAEICYSRSWKPGEREVFLPVPDYWRDLNFLGDGAVFETYDNGTATLTGTMYNTDDPMVLWEVYVFLEDKLNYSEWTSMGGYAKESRGELGDETTWDFYRINGSKSFFRGIGKAEGKLIYLKDSDPLYRFQVGNGANNYNSDFGASGWFETSGSYDDFKGDFNISIDCVIVPGKMPKAKKLCLATQYGEYGHAVYLPINGYNKKYLFEGGFAEFKEYDNGDISLKGTAYNVDDAEAKWEIEMYFSNKVDYDTWKNGGGKLKGANLGDFRKWDYYLIDGSRSFFKGLGKFAGEYLKIDDRFPEYAVQLGDGANDKNGDYGLSTWFSAKGTMNLHGDVNVILECIDEPQKKEENVCYSRPPKEGDRDGFLPLPIYWRDLVFEGEGARFRQFEDGTATLSGTMVNTKDATVRWEVYVLLDGKKSYDEWIAMGLEAKGPEFGDETKWEFYRINGEYSYFKGIGSSNKQYKMTIRDSDARYGFQVGQGANNRNGDYGASGWFITSGSWEGFKGDFNISFECEYMPLADYSVRSADEIDGEYFRTYPNPMRDELTVSGEQLETPEMPYNVRLLDMTGKTYHEMVTKLDTPKRIDVSTLPAGVYTLMILNPETNESEIKRIVKQ